AAVPCSGAGARTGSAPYGLVGPRILAVEEFGCEVGERCRPHFIVRARRQGWSLLTVRVGEAARQIRGEAPRRSPPTNAPTTPSRPRPVPRQAAEPWAPSPGSNRQRHEYADWGFSTQTR